MGNHDFHSAPLGVSAGRISHVHAGFLNISNDTGFTAKNDIVCNLHMTVDTGLACQDAVVSNGGGAGDAGLGDNEAVFPYLYIMSQVYQVIDLGAPSYHRIIQSAVIHSSSCAKLTVIADDCFPQLADMVMMTFFIGGEAKALASYHRMWVT